MRLSVHLSAAVAVLALSACGKDDPVRPDADGERLDAASLAAVTALPLGPGSAAEAGPGTGSAVVAVTPLGGLPAPVCTYQANTGRYDCEPVTNAGVTITRSFAFYDASGQPQRRFDPIATASINTRVTIVGTHTSPMGTTFKVDRKADMTVSGLAGTETSQTLNGVESGTHEASGSSFLGGSYSSKTIANDTTLNVVIPIQPRPAAGQRPPYVFPTSGKRISNMRTTSLDSSNPPPGGAPVELQMRHVVTYSGTSVITIEMTMNDQTKTCTVDLLAPTIQPCFL